MHLPYAFLICEKRKEKETSFEFELRHMTFILSS